MADLTTVLMVARATRNMFNHWALTTNVLRTEYQPTVKGRPRNLTFENALEIAFMAALARGNLTPKDAAEIASHWIDENQRGQLAPFFAMNLNTGAGYGFSNQQLPLSSFARPLADSTGCEASGWTAGPLESTADETVFSEIVVINRREIVRRVAALFAGE